VIPARSLDLSKQALLLLLVGTMIRVPALLSPISEGYRNAQTAALTAGMIENGQLRLDPIAPWRGDLDARLVMELPLYNLAALAIHSLPGMPLDTAGRLASLIFWILSFLALQALWRRTLPPQATFWANLLFIFAPMNWYLSTAFMPESLLQLLAIGFMVFVLDYARKSSWWALTGLFITGLLGLLVKLPAFVHLGLFATLVLVDRQGWRSLFRPTLWAAAIAIGSAIFAWGDYVKTVNTPHFSDWSGWEVLVGFVRPEASRISIGYWLPLGGYNVAFIATVVGIPFVVSGMWIMLRRFGQSFRSRIWNYLFLSLLASWLLWGKAAPVQNYYNLPNLVFFCAAFGLGVTHLNRYLLQRGFPTCASKCWRWGLATSIATLGLLGYKYLARHDHVTVAVAAWVSGNLPLDTPVAYQPRHAPSVMDYQHQPLLSHLTGKRTWILVRTTPQEELYEALDRASYLIVTHPSDSAGLIEKIRQRFKGLPPGPPEPLSQKTGTQKFAKLHETEDFTVHSIISDREIPAAHEN